MIAYAFRWIEWNLGKVAKHGVSPAEAEQVVNRRRAPYPQRIDSDKWLVIGQAEAGRYIEVIYLLDNEETVFVIHARPLNDREKRRYRRRTK